MFDLYILNIAPLRVKYEIDNIPILAIIHKHLDLKIMLSWSELESVNVKTGKNHQMQQLTCVLASAK